MGRADTFETVKSLAHSIATSSTRINLNAIQKHHDKYQQKADAWGSGDFKALIMRNAGIYPEPESKPVNEPPTEPEIQKVETKPKGRPRTVERKPDPEPGKHKVGYRRRLMELSEIGVRIDKMLRKNNTNVQKVSHDLGIKSLTMLRAMRPGGVCRRETFEKIAGYFDVTYDWLVFGKEENGNEA